MATWAASNTSSPLPLSFRPEKRSVSVEESAASLSLVAASDGNVSLVLLLTVMMGATAADFGAPISTYTRRHDLNG